MIILFPCYYTLHTFFLYLFIFLTSSMEHGGHSASRDGEIWEEFLEGCGAVVQSLFEIFYLRRFVCFGWLRVWLQQGGKGWNGGGSNGNGTTANKGCELGGEKRMGKGDIVVVVDIWWRGMKGIPSGGRMIPWRMIYS